MDWPMVAGNVVLQGICDMVCIIGGVDDGQGYLCNYHSLRGQIV